MNLKFFLLSSTCKLAMLWHGAKWWAPYNPWMGMMEEARETATGDDLAMIEQIIGANS